MQPTETERESGVTVCCVPILLIYPTSHQRSNSPWDVPVFLKTQHLDTMGVKKQTLSLVAVALLLPAQCTGLQLAWIRYVVEGSKVSFVRSIKCKATAGMLIILTAKI